MRSQFEYLRPTSLDEAVAMKAEHGDGAYYWAGGTDMMLHWQRQKVAPRFCIDLTFVEAHDTIEVSGTVIVIGAMTSLAQLEHSAARHSLLATLSRITKLMCTPQTRSIATVGGNMCNASPAADLSPAFVAMNASATVMGADAERSVAMIDFFKGVNRTALEGPEILKEIVIPLPRQGEVAASYRRVERTVVDIALVNASTALWVGDEGCVTGARVALGAVAPVIVRSQAAEDILKGKKLSQLDDRLLADAGALATADASPISDVRASAEYRKNMVAVMVRRSLADCVSEIKGRNNGNA